MAETSKPPILVVDDEPEILYSLQALLRREFTVYAAERGKQALEILHQHPVNVIMTDQRMPEMTGVELLSRARCECPQAIRVIFTGYADLKAVIDAVNRGEIYRYLTKPWDSDELCTVLRDACSHYALLAERARLLTDTRDYLSKHTDSDDAGKALLARLDRAAAQTP